MPKRHLRVNSLLKRARWLAVANRASPINFIETVVTIRSSGEFFGHGQLTPRFLIQERILEATTAVESACRGIVLLNLEGYLAATHVLCNDLDFLQERPADPLPPEIFQHHKIMDIYQ